MHKTSLNLCTCQQNVNCFQIPKLDIKRTNEKTSHWCFLGSMVYCVSKSCSVQNSSQCQGPQSESIDVVLEWPLVHNSLLFKGLGAMKYSVNIIHTILYSFELTCVSTVLVSFVNVYLLFSWYNSFPGGLARFIEEISPEELGLPWSELVCLLIVPTAIGFYNQLIPWELTVASCPSIQEKKKQ